MKKLVVGLGNPGKTYKNTRHNIGFLVIDALLASEELNTCKNNVNLHCELSENPGLILAKPTTFMNKSGEAFEALIDYFKLDRTEPNNFLAVHDDLDISFGQLKIQLGHGAAGHKGALSTMEVLPADGFWRMRMGTAGKTKESMPGDAYVLSTFSKEEQEQLPSFINRAVQAIRVFLKKDPEVAAQEYNQKTAKEV